MPRDAWERPTIAGSWLVRDVVAHLADLAFRRVSFHRDAMTPPPPPRPITSERGFVEFINGINADWVTASKRLSPRVLTDVFDKASRDLSEFFEQLPLDAPALFPVSWAGEASSEGWFDVGREFTELWHHQAQIRLAVGAEPLGDPRYAHATLAIAMRGLPHAYRDVKAAEGATVAIDVQGAAGGTWTLVREQDRWALKRGRPETPAAAVTLSNEHAWRLLFNALPEAQVPAAWRVEGDVSLAQPLVHARSVIV
jgi:hypothetical protein